MILSTKHLIGIKYLNLSDIELILNTAQNFKDIIQKPPRKVPSLRDFTIANAFFENSTRTKLSFELAERRLGADIVNFSASGSSVEKGETLLDTINNLIAMKIDMIVMRHPQPGAANFLAAQMDKMGSQTSIINAGDGTHEHPSQALLDTFSILEAFNIKEDISKINKLNIAIIGDIFHSRVALSNIFLLKKLGANVRVCGPPTLIPKYIKSLGVEVSYNVVETLQWCDVANVLRIQLERQQGGVLPSLREYNMQYGITLEKLNKVNKKIVIMHPGPINRGVEIDSEVADGGQSIILNQVENGVAIRMSILYLLSQTHK